MYGRLTKPRILLFVAVLVLIEFGQCLPVNAAVAVIVFDHGFAKDSKYNRRGLFTPVNKTSTFTQDDKYVYAYVTAVLYSANLTWQWYDPTGQLFYNQTDHANCDVSPCSFVNALTVQEAPASTKPGRWRLDLLADGYPLYSDYLMIAPIITQENYWKFNVTQSAPPRAHGELTVTIHPNNQTWRYYYRNMEYADNVTAYEAATNRALNVVQYNASIIIVDFGAAKGDGYTFTLSFDLRWGIGGLTDWDGGSFAFKWQDNPWNRGSWRLGVYPVPETFSITLPKGAILIDTAGIYVMTLNHNLTLGDRPSLSFETVIPPEQSFGWAIIYRDFAYRDSNIHPSSQGVAVAMGQSVPFLPLTLGSLSLWTAIMSVFLLTGSEILSPIYGRTGILIDRRRLRIAALMLAAIFLTITAYQIILSQSPPPVRPSR